jgi:hypothetical protein
MGTCSSFFSPSLPFTSSTSLTSLQDREYISGRNHVQSVVRQLHLYILFAQQPNIDRRPKKKQRPKNKWRPKYHIAYKDTYVNVRRLGIHSYTKLNQNISVLASKIACPNSPNQHPSRETSLGIIKLVWSFISGRVRGFYTYLLCPSCAS